MSVRKYYVKRTLSLFFLIFVGITLGFMIPRLMPGDPIKNIIGQLQREIGLKTGGKEFINEYKKRFGLEGSVLDQYKLFIYNLMRGDLGPSIAVFPTPVTVLIKRALPWSIGLLVSATIISWTLGIVIGNFIAWSKHERVSSVILGLSLIFGQTPFYFLGLIFIYFLAYMIPIFPMAGGQSAGLTLKAFNFEYILDILWHATLPALSIIVATFCYSMMATRQLLLTIKGEDFLMLAEAKGLHRGTIMIKYALRNAILPQVTGLALRFGFMMSGSLITEIIFSYPGLGSLFMLALRVLDYNLMQGLLLFTVISVLLANFMIDILLPLIDPRISREE